MSSPNPCPQPETSYDELDRLVQGALKALNQHVPPERVWKRIRAELKKDEAPPRRVQTTWLPLIVQPALTLLVVALGAIALRALPDPFDIRAPSSSDPSPAATTYVEQDLNLLAQATLDDKADLHSLSKPTLTSSPPHPQAPAVRRPAPGAGELGAMGPIRTSPPLPDARPGDQPPVVIPRDPSPNVLSPEGRALIADLTLQRFALEERQRKHSGPYQWHR
jgi:hypothetical protein